MSQIIVPKPLKSNDTIGIAAPAAAFKVEKFHKGICVLKDMGFNVDIPDGIYARKGYLAGVDKDRARLFESLLSRDDIHAIVCARGGYGSLRILPYLDMSMDTATPKRLIGFSDITPILNILAFNHGWITFHGPVMTQLADADKKTIESFYDALTQPFPMRMPHTDSVNVLSNGNKQSVCGRLWGGNLTTLCHTIGTPYTIDCPENILFLEDRGEAPYRIDRMLTHMRLSGYLDCVKAVLLGTFKDCGEIERIHELVLECFGDDIPVVSGFACGHDLPNHTFPVGLWATLDLADGSVTFCIKECSKKN